MRIAPLPLLQARRKPPRHAGVKNQAAWLPFSIWRCEHRSGHRNQYCGGGAYPPITAAVTTAAVITAATITAPISKGPAGLSTTGTVAARHAVNSWPRLRSGEEAVVIMGLPARLCRSLTSRRISGRFRRKA